MDRMSMMDASFLFSEDGRSHNDVGMVLVFEGPAPSRQEIMQAIADRLALVPRFRQRLRHMPFGLGLPVWVDDVSFEMECHVKVHPRQAADNPVGQAVSRIMSTPMDMTIPLWQVHLVTGLADDRWLLVVRMHHAMVDGVNSTEIVRLLLSPSPEGEPPVHDNWRPRRDVPDHILLQRLQRDAWADAVKAWTSFMSGTVQAPSFPEIDPAALVQVGVPLPPNAINGPVEVGRHYGLTTIPLAKIREIRNGLGGTVNDVVLAACGYGYSKAIAAHLPVEVEGRVMRTMVPVSLHSSGQGGEGSNEIGAMVLEIPLGGMPAVDRLSRIHEQTSAYKSLKKAMPANAINPGSSLMSPMTLMMGSRMAATAPTFVNTVITNVPGPQNPLYLLGRKMHRLGACIALWAPLRMAVSVMSYNGDATINAVTDEGSFPTVTPLLDGITEGFDDLLAAARAAS